MVEVITAPVSTPNPAWLGFVRTGRVGAWGGGARIDPRELHALDALAPIGIGGIAGLNPRPDISLTTNGIGLAARAAALAEAEGMITDLDVDGDDVSPYDASVLTADSRSIDIEFDADFAVVGTDID